MQKVESRVARVQGQRQAETVTVVVVSDKNFYGNASLLPSRAWLSDGRAAGNDEGATPSKPGDDD